jgi:hypothetical protein
MSEKYLYRKYLNKLNESIQKANKAKLALSKVKSNRQGVTYEYDYTIARANYDWMLNKINIYKELIIDLGADPTYINLLIEDKKAENTQAEANNIKHSIISFLKDKIDQSEWIELLSDIDHDVNSFCEMMAEEWVKRGRGFNKNSATNQKGIITFTRLWIKNIRK